MRTLPNHELIALLSSDLVNLRTFALHTLCEGYADRPAILDAVWSSWDRLGVAEAFPEFPLISYFPISPDKVEESCHRAARMVENRPLTSTETRCAGKLVEQLVVLPASELESHLALIESTTGLSKIFFRVDLAALRTRITLLSKSADELAAILDTSIDQIASGADDRAAVQLGLQALETLRRVHPDYMNLAGGISQSPNDSGHQAVGFQLTLQSLVQFEHPGIESCLATHLHDQREAIFSIAVEALVRAGTQAAADAFLKQFSSAGLNNQRWIARGLQRIRVDGLADRIAALRSSVSETNLWMMLLIAEVRQLDSQSSRRIAKELGRISAFSESLIDSLNLFAWVTENAEGATEFQAAFVDYMERANQETQEQLTKKKAQAQRAIRKTRAQLSQEVIARYRSRE